MIAQPWKKANVCDGVGTLIRKLKMMSCMALIMPHSCCREPPMIRETTKLPDCMKLMNDPSVSVESLIVVAAPASRMGGTMRNVYSW